VTPAHPEILDAGGLPFLEQDEDGRWHEIPPPALTILVNGIAVATVDLKALRTKSAKPAPPSLK
jgi:hypothetical protein